MAGLSTRDGLPDDRVWAVAEDPAGGLWFSAFESNVCCYDGDKVVARRGGTFTDAKGKPKVFAFGLDVFARATGQPSFDSEKVHKAKDRQIADMPNLVVAGNTVYYATQHSLRAFDLQRLDYQLRRRVG